MCRLGFSLFLSSSFLETFFLLLLLSFPTSKRNRKQCAWAYVYLRLTNIEGGRARVSAVYCLIKTPNSSHSPNNRTVKWSSVAVRKWCANVLEQNKKTNEKWDKNCRIKQFLEWILSCYLRYTLLSLLFYCSNDNVITYTCKQPFTDDLTLYSLRVSIIWFEFHWCESQFGDSHKYIFRFFLLFRHSFARGSVCVLPIEWFVSSLSCNGWWGFVFSS